MEKRKYNKPLLDKINLDCEISVLMLSTTNLGSGGAGNQTGTEDQQPCVNVGCFINPFKWLK